MPKFYKYSDPNYFDEITRPELRSRSAITREVLPGWDLGAVFMGEDLSNQETPVASMLFIAPGETLPRHAHDCFRVEVIVRGSLEVAGVTYEPGDIMVSHAGEAYGPHTAGPEGCLSVEIFSRAGGMSPLTEENEQDERALEITRKVNEALARLARKEAEMAAAQAGSAS